MNALAKIITGTLVAGSLLMGIPSCKNKSQEEDAKYTQRVQALEQVVSRYEKSDFNEKEGKEAMLNCLTDVKNLLELFVPSYEASEKEYAQCVELVRKYCEISAADVASKRRSEIGQKYRTRKLMDTAAEYESQFDQQHKKPFEQIELVKKTVFQQEKPGDMPQVCADASNRCYELFEAVEKVIKSDIRYLNSTIEYAEKNKDKESELICRLVKIFQEQRESVRSKAEYYKSTFKQHSEVLKKYFPSKPEEKAQNF